VAPWGLDNVAAGQAAEAPRKRPPPAEQRSAKPGKHSGFIPWKHINEKKHRLRELKNCGGKI